VAVPVSSAFVDGDVPKGDYFIMGDNRGESCDSRRWGSVPKAKLIGKVFQIERGG
jgi:signal peptidase I